MTGRKITRFHKSTKIYAHVTHSSHYATHFSLRSSENSFNIFNVRVLLFYTPKSRCGLWMFRNIETDKFAQIGKPRAKKHKQCWNVCVRYGLVNVTELLNAKIAKFLRSWIEEGKKRGSPCDGSQENGVFAKYRYAVKRRELK